MLIEALIYLGKVILYVLGNLVFIILIRNLFALILDKLKVEDQKRYIKTYRYLLGPILIITYSLIVYFLDLSSLEKILFLSGNLWSYIEILKECNRDHILGLVLTKISINFVSLTIILYVLGFDILNIVFYALPIQFHYYHHLGFLFEAFYSFESTDEVGNA